MKLKFLFLLLFFIGIYSCSLKEKEENDLFKYNLKGKVKSIKFENYYAMDEFGEIKKGYHLNNSKYETRFNLKGFIEESITYDTLDNLLFTKNYYYTSSTNIDKIIYNKGEKTHVENYKYDINGKLQQINYYDEERLLTKYIYIWNPESIAADLMIEEYSGRNEGLMGYKLLSYYENGFIKEEKKIEYATYYDDYKEISYHYFYNEEGDLIKKNCNVHTNKDDSYECRVYEYKEFDHKDNYMYKIVYIDNFVKYIQERTIDYW